MSREATANVAGLSTQMSAFIALGVDAGPRKGELCGLRWTDVNLDRGKVSIVRQFITPGREPVFDTIKRENPRVVDITPEAVARLKAHKRAHHNKIWGF